MLSEMGWVAEIRHPALTPVMIFVSAAGGGTVMLAALALAYWLWRPGPAARLIAITIVSALLNTHLKAAIAMPRPDAIDRLVAATNWGMPSGHAQRAAVVLLWLAFELRRPWVWAAAGVGIPLVGLSRIYLGVHTAGQVLAGYGAGLVLVGFFAAMREPGRRIIERLPASVILLALGLVLGLWVSVVPDLGGPGSDSTARAGAALDALLLAGFAAGAIRERRLGLTAPASDWRRRAIMALSGLAGLAVLVLAVQAEPRAIRITGPLAALAGGLWVAHGAPALFRHLGLGR